MLRAVETIQDLEARQAHVTPETELGFLLRPRFSERQIYEVAENYEDRLANLSEMIRSFPSIIALLDHFGDIKIYAVGGIVRDCIIGRSSKDIDLVIGGVPIQELADFLKTQGRVIEASTRTFGTLKFSPTEIPENTLDTEDPNIDIALPRSEASTGQGGRRDFNVNFDETMPIEKDLGRRDFGIGSLGLLIDKFSFSLQTHLIDPYNGLRDLQEGIVKAVGDPKVRFSEDISRVLRALRFACVNGMEIDAETWRAIKLLGINAWNRRLNEQGRLEQLASPQTIANEFLKGLKADPTRMIRLMLHSGMLLCYIPELIDTIGVDQAKTIMRHGKEIPAHRYDVFGHTLAALAVLPKDADINLIVATPLHDIGKPLVAERKANGNNHFIGHAEKSAEMAAEIIRRLHLDAGDRKKGIHVDIAKVQWLIANHMVLFELGQDHRKMPQAITNLLDHNEWLDDLIILFTADLIGSNGIEPGSHNEMLLQRTLEWRKNGVVAKKEIINGREVARVEWFVTGDVIAELIPSLPKGPAYGYILNEARNAQLNNEFTDPISAKSWLLKFYEEHKLDIEKIIADAKTRQTRKQKQKN